MKTYPVIISKNGTGIDVKSPSGKTITISDRQLSNASMSQNLFYRRFKTEGMYELTKEDMENLLILSKLPMPKLTGKTLVALKKGGKYYTYEMKFNDEKHESNYINKMINNGYSLVGTEQI